MTGARDVTQLCCSSNLAGIVANKIEQSFYSVYSYSGIESIERALSLLIHCQNLALIMESLIFAFLAPNYGTQSLDVDIDIIYYNYSIT